MDPVIQFGLDHYKQSVRMAHSMGIPPHLAEDVVSDAFLNIVKREGPVVENEASYWWTTIRNLCRSYSRRPHEQSLAEECWASDHPVDVFSPVWKSGDEARSDPLQAAIDSEAKGRLSQLLGTLTGAERRAMDLNLQGLEQPAPAGRVNLYRARVRLRKQLALVAA
jgi:DNA-directed RNA polymerase specialized sigma24 family protein